MHHPAFKAAVAAVCFGLFLTPAIAATKNTPPAAVHWVGSWASAQMIPTGDNALGTETYRNATLRQIVHLSLGGATLRVHLSNAFGTAPLHIQAVHVARARAPGQPAIDPVTDKALSFDGRADVTIPAGAEYLSDPIALDMPAHGDLAISIFYDSPPSAETSHPGARSTSYLIPGNHVADETLPADAKNFEHWFQISAVDVLAPQNHRAIVALGDSITDGRGATTNGNNRWPDMLAGQLQKTGVLNAGIGGGRILNDGLGPNALARFDRDVLGQSAVRAVIMLEGVNDLGALTIKEPASPAQHAEMVRRITGAYAQVIERAHAAGLKAYGATITPYGGSDYYHPTAENEADRQAINAWIRTPGHFDGVADFDAALRDPEHSDRLRPEYDSGDHLHPSAAAYRLMGGEIAAKLLKEH